MNTMDWFLRQAIPAQGAQTKMKKATKAAKVINTKVADSRIADEVVAKALTVNVVLHLLCSPRKNIQIRGVLMATKTAQHPKMLISDAHQSQATDAVGVEELVVEEVKK